MLVGYLFPVLAQPLIPSLHDFLRYRQSQILFGSKWQFEQHCLKAKYCYLAIVLSSPIELLL
jgi:hypothetical protein